MVGWLCSKHIIFETGMMAGLEQNQIAGLASGILLYGKRRRRRLENTMFFCVLLCSLPCMELLLLLAAAATTPPYATTTATPHRDSHRKHLVIHPVHIGFGAAVAVPRALSTVSVPVVSHHDIALTHGWVGAVECGETEVGLG